MDKIKKVENYFPITLLFLLFLLANMSETFFIMFITSYVLVGLFLVINTWRMYEEELEFKEKRNTSYYLIYGSIVVYYFILFVYRTNEGNVVWIWII